MTRRRIKPNIYNRLDEEEQIFSYCALTKHAQQHGRDFVIFHTTAKEMPRAS